MGIGPMTLNLDAPPGFRGLDPHRPVSIPIDAGEEGMIQLIVRGSPSDAVFRNQVWKHERVHVRDTAKAVGLILKPWDDALQACRSEGRSFRGRSVEDARFK